jgi:tetratricopeptide (TPR) repeat protein
VAACLELEHQEILNSVLPTYPPLEAYRRDAARLAPGEQFGPNDSAWLAAATLLHRYVRASAEERTVLATELAAALAGHDDLTFVGAGLRTATQIEKFGALHLAVSWLALLEGLVPQQPSVDSGRMLSHRARLLRKFGHLDDALALYEQVDALGQVLGEPELTARAWLGFAILAHTRGNYPEARRWYHASALLADDNHCAEQSLNAHLGLHSMATLARDYDHAMMEGWRAFLLAAGDGMLEAEALANLGQTMHETGAHQAALRAFAAAVGRASHPDMLLPSLGGAAMAAAAIGQPSIVDAASVRINRISSSVWPYPMALALLDLGDARDMLGDSERAARDRARAKSIADANGFHALSYRAENPPAFARPMVNAHLHEQTAAIVGCIEQLDAPDDLCAYV